MLRSHPNPPGRTAAQLTQTDPAEAASNLIHSGLVHSPLTGKFLGRDLELAVLVLFVVCVSLLVEDGAVLHGEGFSLGGLKPHEYDWIVAGLNFGPRLDDDRFAVVIREFSVVRAALSAAIPVGVCATDDGGAVVFLGVVEAHFHELQPRWDIFDAGRLEGEWGLGGVVQHVKGEPVDMPS